jgi:hypothetical protein
MSQLLGSLYPLDASRQIRAQQAGIGGLESQTANCSQPPVDGCSREPASRTSRRRTIIRCP